MAASGSTPPRRAATCGCTPHTNRGRLPPSWDERPRTQERQALPAHKVNSQPGEPGEPGEKTGDVRGGGFVRIGNFVRSGDYVRIGGFVRSGVYVRIGGLARSGVFVRNGVFVRSGGFVRS